MQRTSIAAGFALLVGAGSSLAQWQCVPHWERSAIPGIWGVEINHESIQAMEWWDPDGAGPRERIALIGGEFVVAGDVAANALVGFNPADDTWERVATPIAGIVTKILPLDGGQFIIKGVLRLPGAAADTWLAKWNGVAWEDWAVGLQGDVYDIAKAPSGGFFAAGTFGGPAPSSFYGLIRRTADGWERVGPVNGTSLELCAADDEGNVYGVRGTDVLRWDGQSWSTLFTVSGGVSFYQPYISVFAWHPGFGLAVGGVFYRAGTVSGSLVFWSDGALWPAPVPTWNRTDVFRPSGDGSFFSVSASYAYAGQWDRQTWRFDGHAEQVNIGAWINHVLPVTNSDLLIGSVQNSIAGLRSRALFRLRPDGWHTPGRGFSDWVVSLKADGEEQIALGLFTAAGGLPAGGVARSSPDGWRPLGSGFNATPKVSIRLADGRLLVGGYFGVILPDGVDHPDSRPATSCAVYDGRSWNPMDAGLRPISNGVLRCFLKTNDGQLLAGGKLAITGGSTTGLVRWDGAAWQSVSGLLPTAEVYSLCQLDDGSILAAGYELLSASAWQVARLRGGVWTNFSPAGLRCKVMYKMPNGDLLCGGGRPSMFWRWESLTNRWIDLAPNRITGMEIFAIEPLPRPDGGIDLLVGGNFTRIAGQNISHIARWVPETNQWFAVGAGANAPVRTIVSFPNGDVAVGGEFSIFDGDGAAFHARWRVPCPADFTCDRLVDGDDVIGFFQAWDARHPEADSDRDGDTDSDDMFRFMDDWDAGC